MYYPETVYSNDNQDKLYVITVSITLMISTYLFLYTHYSQCYNNPSCRIPNNIQLHHNFNIFICCIIMLLTIMLKENIVSINLYLGATSTLTSLMGLFIASFIAKEDGFIPTEEKGHILSKYAYWQITFTFIVCVLLWINGMFQIIEIHIDTCALLVIMWSMVYNRLFCDIQMVGLMFAFVLGYVFNVGRYTPIMKGIMFSVLIFGSLLVTDKLHRDRPNHARIIFTRVPTEITIALAVVFLILLSCVSHFDLDNDNSYEFSLIRCLLLMCIYMTIAFVSYTKREIFRYSGPASSAVLSIVLFIFVLFSPIQKENHNREDTLDKLDVFNFVLIEMAMLIFTIYDNSIDHWYTNNKRYVIMMISTSIVILYYVMKYYDINLNVFNLPIFSIVECIVKLSPVALISLIHENNSLLAIISSFCLIILVVCVFAKANNKLIVLLTWFYAFLVFLIRVFRKTRKVNY